jgi:hypothetical protein
MIRGTYFNTWGTIALAGVLLMLLASCGKKGPPTLTQFQPPPPVERLSAVHRDGTIILTWAYAKPKRLAVRGFYIERSTANGPFVNMGFVPAEQSLFVDRQFEIDTSYRYRLRVYSMRDVFSGPSPELTVIPEPLPAAPTGLRFEADAQGMVLSWAPSGDNVTYTVFTSIGPGTSPWQPLNAVPIAEPRYHTGIPAGASASFTVRAVRQGSIANEGALSDVLEIPAAAFVPASPRELSGVRAHDRMYLSWKDNPEKWITGYRVYRRLEGRSFTAVGTVTIPFFTDQQASSGDAVYYVTALGPAAESGASGSVTVPVGKGAR